MHVDDEIATWIECALVVERRLRRMRQEEEFRKKGERVMQSKLAIMREMYSTRSPISRRYSRENVVWAAHVLLKIEKTAQSHMPRAIWSRSNFDREWKRDAPVMQRLVSKST